MEIVKSIGDRGRPFNVESQTFEWVCSDRNWAGGDTPEASLCERAIAIFSWQEPPSFVLDFEAPGIGRSARRLEIEPPPGSIDLSSI
ncbi:hypothetical protein [Oxynema aestuarii]|uniref:Uncharacterized protein n=1 Tax=Oxynema aestuarii AP17 TaxID=2064643 RepID=A0A6H1TWR7_9CYAN|nr:hypothetical protein [Oxynema aestuarii]QIZ70213.1 hypothetical protein HCG48_06210 [Oxynema aestuarii AP17]RMH77126.1 MAG: hypothetical protein D6680_06135 [Cyanobacteria bacterium J007]